MAEDNRWKNTGHELGSAFKQFGKAFIKTAKYSTEKAVEWAESEDRPGDGAAAGPEQPENSANAGTNADAASSGTPQNENVFKDGTWRNTGKSVGHAFKTLGNSILDTLDEGLNGKDNPKTK